MKVNHKFDLTAMSLIRVLINGSKGRMGQESVKAVSADAELDLVAQTDLGDNLVFSSLDDLDFMVAYTNLFGDYMYDKFYSDDLDDEAKELLETFKSEEGFIGDDDNE